MERFDAMLEAAEFAATLCKSWSFATSNDRYDVKGLLVLAETSDSENPIDEDSFYVSLIKSLPRLLYAVQQDPKVC